MCLQEGIGKFFEAAQAAKAALEEATPLLEEATQLTKEITPLLQVGRLFVQLFSIDPAVLYHALLLCLCCSRLHSVRSTLLLSHEMDETDSRGLVDPVTVLDSKHVLRACISVSAKE